MNTDPNLSFNQNPATNKTVRARAYIRVSLVGDRKETLRSDKLQLDEAKRYAEYLGFGFDEEASRANADLDVSGFRKPWRQRPGLMAHYEAAKRGEFDALVFYKISRLARNVKEALDMIDAFEKLGVSFHFVAERIDSTSAQGRFLRNVLLSAAEMQSEDISSFLKSTVARRAREGKLQGATPVWIRKVGKQKEGIRYEIIPEQVEAIRRLIELRLQGIGYVKAAQRLNEEGYRTVNGKDWTGGMTYKYLQPTWVETMLGVGFYGRDTGEPFRIPDALPPIITQEEADRLMAVQRLYSDDYGRKPVQGLDWMINKRRKNGRRSADAVHILSGILFCPYCGARMVVHMSSAKEERASPVRYICPRYISSAEAHRKGLSIVNASSMEDAVLRVLRGVLAMPTELVESKPRKAQKKGNDIAAIQSKIDRLVNLHLEGRIDEADFNRVYAELVVEKEKAQQATISDPVTEQRAQAMDLMSKDDLTREELRQLLLLMVERVEAPIVLEGVTIRPDRKTLRRLARIRMRFPNSEGVEEYLSAIYMDEYGGTRDFIPVKEGEEPDLKRLIGDRPQSRSVEKQANLLVDDSG